MRFLSSRAWDLAELIIGYGLILSVIWTTGNLQRGLYWTAFLWIAVAAFLRRRETQPNGFGLRGLWPSLWILPVAAALFCFGIWIAARLHSLHHLYGPLPVVGHIAEYAIWALMQQFILQVYFLLRLIRLGMSRAWAVTLAALLFASAHIPNPVLVPATIIWGVLSCLLYLRYRNLYALAIAHGTLGMCLAICVPNAINRHMRVGIGYLHYPYANRSHLEITGR